MAETVEKLLTFEEFARLNTEGRYELVNGRLETLVPPMPRHGWTGGRIFRLLDEYLEIHDPDGYWGVELDIPTLPFHGRRPDYAYYSAVDVPGRVDLEADRVTGVPTLVVEVVSPDDEERDTVVKRREYAEVGIAHYWILRPRERTALLLVLRDGRYEVAGNFSGDDTLTSELFPGLQIPLRRLFR